MERFETEVLATADNRVALTELSGHWIDRVHATVPPNWITLDMDSSVSPTQGIQEGTAWNGQFGCMCYHPPFPRVGFVVTNLPMDPDCIIHFCNQRGTAAQHIKEGRRSTGHGWPQWQWHLDEMFVKINDEQHYLWRAVDYEG